VDAERNHAALLTAARQLFDERGTDVPLDEVAKNAKVANATLYRHFATRVDLIVAVYAEELTDLDRFSELLMNHPDPDQAFTDWLRAFIHHVGTKRHLAQAVPDEPEGDRGALFADWHAAMEIAAARLLARARQHGGIRTGFTAADLLAVTSAIALTGISEDRLDVLLDLIRNGYRPRHTTSENGTRRGPYRGCVDGTAEGAGK
jgi:AcrR family transcriptional regulator